MVMSFLTDESLESGTWKQVSVYLSPQILFQSGGMTPNTLHDEKLKPPTAQLTPIPSRAEHVLSGCVPGAGPGVVPVDGDLPARVGAPAAHHHSPELEDPPDRGRTGHDHRPERHRVSAQLQQASPQTADGDEEPHLTHTHTHTCDQRHSWDPERYGLRKQTGTQKQQFDLACGESLNVMEILWTVPSDN
ncbi:hypothetical protein F2P79_022873 [Pimephales promelas]|nr:hypothetical protein F2P79_022873 [Pimephales promelas]